MVDGYRESRKLEGTALDLKRRGLETGPELAVGDGALGSGRRREVYGETRVQRCWVHKTANVLNQMPLQAAKGHLLVEADDFSPKVSTNRRLVKDRAPAELLRLPGEHWKPAPPTPSKAPSPRLVKTKGCLDGARHGLQTDLECQAEMAEAGRIKSTRRTL